MTAQEQDKWDSVNYRMNAEGFHYCFKHYSHWKEIEDVKFHELREKYLKASEDLQQYVEERADEDSH